MPFDRRTLLSAGFVSAGLGLAAAASAATAGAREKSSPRRETAAGGTEPAEPMIAPGDDDQTEALQTIIDAAAARGVPVLLPPGRFKAGRLVLRPGTTLVGAHRRTVLEYIGGGAFLTAEGAEGISLEGLTLDGAHLALDPAAADGLIAMTECTGLVVSEVDVQGSLLNGISLRRCSGRVSQCRISLASQAGLRSLDATGLEIVHNTISHCANNGIQIWREAMGEDGTIVAGNRIEDIAARAGGSGENGNGISVFRAGNVLVSGNRIADCAYTAVRANAASNVQIVANNCSRLGEVAIYAEFGFEGALIANNLVDRAASGIEVTNFNDGGRLAVVQGNVIRNLFRREAEPVDKRGDGIGIEADAVVTGNVIENAPSAGIVVGWGKFMRDVSVTGNLVRNAEIGILLTSDPAAGACLIAQNMISGAKGGAIRAMNHGVPEGPDLALEAPQDRRLAIAGNMTV